mmetsp:Transcript_57557/g.114233  ORF Transcript_57557/g.114233 Transcript_57557/m.114233 type:complete len:107 (-) Transcript_57557:60-380(-)
MVTNGSHRDFIFIFIRPTERKQELLLNGLTTALLAKHQKNSAVLADHAVDPWIVQSPVKKHTLPKARHAWKPDTPERGAGDAASPRANEQLADAGQLIGASKKILW